MFENHLFMTCTICHRNIESGDHFVSSSIWPTVTASSFASELVRDLSENGQILCYQCAKKALGDESLKKLSVGEADLFNDQNKASESRHGH